jgi:DNA (cytosine-5)-methyltransferase 1
MTVRFVDLCCGVGGLSRPLHKLGGQCVLACDIDKYTKITYEANHGTTKWFFDVTKLDEKTVPEHDVLFAGFPCQPFSNAGLKKGFSDTRGTIFRDVARIIKEKQPKYFLLENVKGLLTNDGGNTFVTIIRELTDCGYKVQHQLLNSVNFVPQKRKRVFIFGQRLDLEQFVNLPVSTPDLRKGRTLGSIYHTKHNIVESDNERFYSFSTGILPKFYHSEHMRDWALAYTEHKRKTTGFGFQYVTSKDIASTLTARYHKDGSEVTINDNPLRPRKLTPRECFRLMGFDDSFILPNNVSNTQLYKQAGNSVVPACAEVFIREMRKL